MALHLAFLMEALSLQGRLKNTFLSKHHISPSSRFHLPVPTVKKEFYTYVLPQSIRTTLHLPADPQTYPQGTLEGSKSLEAAGGLNRNVSLPPLCVKGGAAFPSPSLGY